MRGGRPMTVVCWAVWSAIVAAGIIYLGSNTEAYRDRVWPLAGLTGAALGAAGGLAALRVCGNRTGALLLSIPVGFLLGVGGSLLWAGK